ncbi:MAG: hypothetical protein QGG39_12780 [Candidatus Poribacteria bacterium]|nr:hypothetical protein [Candidatus Poribacteria bacterium]
MGGPVCFSEITLRHMFAYDGGTTQELAAAGVVDNRPHLSEIIYILSAFW